MTLNTNSIMSGNFTSNNIENDENNPNSEESDYNNLITRLKEIKKNNCFIGKNNI